MSIKKYKNVKEITIIRIFFWDIYKINSNFVNSLFRNNSFKIDLFNDSNDDLFDDNAESHRIYILKSINTKSLNVLTNQTIKSTKLWIHILNDILQWFLRIQDRFKNKMHIFITLCKMRFKISIIFNETRDYRDLFKNLILIEILFIDVMKQIK